MYSVLITTLLKIPEMRKARNEKHLNHQKLHTCCRFEKMKSVCYNFILKCLGINRKSHCDN